MSVEKIYEWFTYKKHKIWNFPKNFVKILPISQNFWFYANGKSREPCTQAYNAPKLLPWFWKTFSTIKYVYTKDAWFFQNSIIEPGRSLVWKIMQNVWSFSIF